MYGIDQDYNARIWQLIIRARYEAELDALVASIAAGAVAQVAPREMALKVAEVAFASVREERAAAPATPESRFAALEVVADWDGDLCPRIPWPRPHYADVEEVGDPMLNLVLTRASTLVDRAGSDQLRGTLGSVLRGLNGSSVETEQVSAA